MIALFRNCFVFLISLLASTALAVGSKPSGKVGASRSHPYQNAAWQQPNSQGESSSSPLSGERNQNSAFSSVQTVKVIPFLGHSSVSSLPPPSVAILPRLSLSQSAFERVPVVSAVPFSSLAHIPIERLNTPVERPEILSPQCLPSSSQLFPPQCLPPLSQLFPPQCLPPPFPLLSATPPILSRLPASSFGLMPLAPPPASEEVLLAQRQEGGFSQETGSISQGQSEATSDFSDPKLDADEVEKRLQNLHDALAAPKKGKSVKLCLHIEYFFLVVDEFERHLSLPPIALELCEFQLRSVTEKKFDMAILKKFLKELSPTLTKICFNNCCIVTAYMHDLHDLIRDRNLLKNIIEFKFIMGEMAFSPFSVLLRTMQHMEELQYLTLDIKKSKAIKKELKKSSLDDIKSGINSIVNNKKLKKLTLGGDIFDENMMEYFIYAMMNLVVNSEAISLEELNVLETNISQNSIINLLENLHQNSLFLNQLKKLYIPNIISDDRDNILLLIEDLQRKRGLEINR